MPDLLEQFGPIDIYLFDQLLRGRIAPGMKILDAGCGVGRNLVYLLLQHYEVFGIDQDPQAIDDVRHLAAVLYPDLPGVNFQVGKLEAMRHPDFWFDVVISNAVLHFAQDDKQFQAMLKGIWRVLKPGGILFCRTASSIGMDKKSFQRIAGHRYLLPDGSERYLVNQNFLQDLAEQLSAELLDPIKTTVVQDQRCMTTWVLRKLEVQSGLRINL